MKKRNNYVGEPSKGSSTGLLVVRDAPNVPLPIDAGCGKENLTHRPPPLDPPTSSNGADVPTPLSLPYSWTTTYDYETPNERRRRWIEQRTFGPVVESIGGNTASTTTPYVYRSPRDVWGGRGEVQKSLFDAETSQMNDSDVVLLPPNKTTSKEVKKPTFQKTVNPNPVALKAKGRSLKPIVSDDDE